MQHEPLHARSTGAFCNHCETRCLLRQGDVGSCGLRTNVGGRIRSLVSDVVQRITQVGIEAAGFYHVVPGTRALAVSMGEGVPRHCGWPAVPRRRNRPARSHQYSLRDLPELARRYECDSVLFHQVDPVYVPEAVERVFAGPSRGFYRLIQTQAGMTPESLDRLSPLLDGASVVVSTMRDSTARAFGTVPPHIVRANLRRLRERGVWVEVMTPIRPDINSGAAELMEIALSLHQVDPSIPWHLHILGAAGSHAAVAARKAVSRAFSASRRIGLKNVYTMGSGVETEELTFCHECLELLVARYQGDPWQYRLPKDHRCPVCSTRAPGLFTRIRPMEEEAVPSS